MNRRALYCVIFSAVFCISGLSLHAKRNNQVMNTPNYDDRIFHFGFLLGGNVMNFSASLPEDVKLYSDSLYGITTKTRGGFSVGIVSDLRLGKYFNLRFIPTFSLGERVLRYHLPDGFSSTRVEEKIVESTLVEFPLEIKWKAKRLLNSRPYITLGAKYVMDLASLAKKRELHQDEYLVKLKNHDFGFTVGVGWDFFLPFNSKLALELKLFFGLNDLIVKEGNLYTDYFDSLQSRIIQFCITFE